MSFTILLVRTAAPLDAARPQHQSATVTFKARPAEKVCQVGSRRGNPIDFLYLDVLAWPKPGWQTQPQIELGYAIRQL